MYDYTFFLVLIGTGLLGFVSGVIGSFAVLSDMSLFGDVLSHAALPGIAGIFLCTHSSNPFILLCGGALSSVCGALLVHTARMVTRLKLDALLGLSLSVFFGFGLLLITIIQKYSLANQGFLSKLLLGNAALLLYQDIVVMSCMSIVVFVTLSLFWKELILVLFDRNGAQAMGYSLFFFDCLVTGLLILVVVAGLQMVGVILMSSLLIAPAVAARQWTSRVSSMVVLAGFFGAIASIIGSVLSAFYYRVPTGPAIVLVISVWVIISLLCAPNRGIIWRKFIGKYS